MRALNTLRDGPNYCRPAFDAGLTRAGYRVVTSLPDPQPDDVLLLWNRSIRDEPTARRFEAAGALVLVSENGYLGKTFAGRKWFALSIGHHNGRGQWPDGGPERWDSLGVDLEPWRTGGDEVVVLPQRGIGEPGVAMPRNWPASRYGRVRPHPGIHACVPLRDDLACARYVVTWGSGAAILALLWGIPVYYGLQGWIGAPAALPLSEIGGEPKRDGRLAMFRRLAWAQWCESEIESGQPFEMLRQVGEITQRCSSSSTSPRSQAGPLSSGAGSPKGRRTAGRSTRM